MSKNISFTIIVLGKNISTETATNEDDIMYNIIFIAEILSYAVMTTILRLIFNKLHPLATCK